MKDDQITDQAKAWVRENRKKIIAQICGEELYQSEPIPLTIFMAGSPGAGKTEFSKSLIDSFAKPIIRIDADDIREMMKCIGYDGENAHLYNDAAVKGVNRLYDHVLAHRLSAVIDGTFAYGGWRENIERSLQKDREVAIYYVYQDPVVAWDFVRRREANEGRRVPKGVFVDSYLKSIENVTKAIEVFGEKIKIFYAQHNYKKDIEKLEVEVDNIVKFIPKSYTLEELEKIVYERKNP